MTSCGECGFVYDDLATDGIADALESVASRLLRELGPLAGGDTPFWRRPDPATWSALEYACHIRDVFLVQRERVLTALVEDRPRLAPMYREERVVLAGYEAEDLRVVLDEVTLAARLLARLLRRLSGDELRRRCTYSFPSMGEVDLAWVGRHTVHEGEHHLGDIGRVVALVSGE